MACGVGEVEGFAGVDPCGVGLGAEVAGADDFSACVVGAYWLGWVGFWLDAIKVSVHPLVVDDVAVRVELCVQVEWASTCATYPEFFSQGFVHEMKGSPCYVRWVVGGGKRRVC